MFACNLHTGPVLEAALLKFLINWLVNAAALGVTALIIPGIIVLGTPSLLLAALVIGLINAVIRPLLLILTLPITVITLGLFYFVLNGFLLWLAAAATPGFHLEGFFAAVLGAILLSIVASLIHLLIPGERS